MKTFALFLLFLILFPGNAYGVKYLSGPATVIDGDTIVVSGRKIRLFGIDAPEKNQPCWYAAGKKYPCGYTAARHLRKMIQGKTVRCDARGKDRYRRVIGLCTIDDLEIGGSMVSAGHAMAYVRYSSRYKKEEALARESRVGIWQGPFDAPWIWRRSKPR